MNKISLLLLSILVASCTSLPEKKEAVAAPPTYKETILKAQSISKSNPNGAINLLNDLLSNNPENNLSDDALFLMGTILENQKNFDAALKSYSRILSSRYLSPLDGKTILKKSELLMKLGRDSEALQTLNYVNNYDLVDQSSLYSVEKMRSKLLFKNKNYFDFLVSAHNIIATSKSESEKQETFKQAVDVIKIKMDKGDNKKILDNADLSIFHSQAALSLAEYYVEDEKPEAALSILEKYAHLFTSPFYKSQRDELIRRTQLYSTPNIDTIGVILPLSGKYQSVGQDILKGLQYALGTWDRNPSGKNFKLTILDSEADPNQASFAFDEMMAKDKPIAIIGGLVSRTAEVLISKSKEYKVPTIVLSQKEGLVANEKYAFQNAQSMKAYTDLVADISVNKLGFKKAAVLQSKQNFSTLYAESFKKSFMDAGGEIVTSVDYDLEEKRSLPTAVKTLVKLDKVSEERKNEYIKALEAWKKSPKSRGATSIPKLEEILPPQVDFDVLFVSDGAKNGGLIASTLAYYDVEKLPLIGTHLWNDVALLERGQRFVEGAIFASDFYEPQVFSSQCGQDFQQKFQELLSAYNYKGLESGLILKKVFNNFSIDSRASLLSALQSASTLTDTCLMQGLLQDEHNFYSPFLPLMVQNKSIVVFDPQNYHLNADQSPKFENKGQ